MPSSPEATIKKNILRRKSIVNDRLDFFEKNPNPTWIELSIIDVCNRSCSFCPKSDPSVAPDTYQQMSLGLIKKIAKDAKKISFKGAFALCGYGEPLLHKEVMKIVEILSKVSDVEIITNGDTLNAKLIQKLYKANLKKLLVSLYDGPEQIKKFEKMINEAKVPLDFVILRDRWYDKTKNFGVKLTNRTGTISIGDQLKVGIHKVCYYPSYQILIDWDGNTYLCPQDWQRRISMGNIMQQDFNEIWVGKFLTKYRKKLLQGDRSLSPCNTCNAQGTLLGVDHALEWKKIYKI
jgi:radical SAM protein with 4Fe4S-binding SPASM domain